MKKRPVVIGITGGSGSGKTTVVDSIKKQFQNQNIVIIVHDDYYKDQSHLPMSERAKTNYDHPFAFDTPLLVENLDQLIAGEAIEKPRYDFTQHTRSSETEHIEPKDVIIVEGILVLEDAALRERMDIKIFVDTDADLRILRRLVRDIHERGRTVDSVIEQYLSSVRPMHNQFIEPTKRYADLIIPEGGQNHVAIDIMVTKIQTILEQTEVLR
ncbi:MAG: uridine kinase [Bacilli bacterium]